MKHTKLELQLVEALMDVCWQRMSAITDLDNFTVHHDFMSDAEQALKLLGSLGFADTEDSVYYKLRYDKLKNAQDKWY